VDLDGENDFQEYVASRYRSLLGMAYLLCGNHGHAEDLVQNALAKAYLAWHRVRRDSADSYVRRVLARGLDRLRTALVAEPPLAESSKGRKAAR
jgi:DNA-directed RNA polymerase specialized sigma24 family protein